MTPLEGFFCLSAHSRWANVSDRERLALAPTLMAPFLKSLNPNLPHAFYYLTTCHRVEVYGFGADPLIIRNAWCEATGASIEAIKIWRNIASLEHFVRVGAGLESEIIGETQIIGQVRSSMTENRELGLLSSPMSHILQRGLRIARTIRTESRIGEGRENLSSLAIMSLFDIFESLTDKRFLIVGAGSMALLAIEKLKEIKASRITWINRSREKIEAHPYARFCNVEEFSKLGSIVSQFDVVILATASPHPIVSKASVSLPLKKSNLRVILDLGLPRNASDDLSDLGFILRNVDEFVGVLDNKDALQRERIDHAERVLRRDLAAATNDLDLSLLGPLKTEFINKWKWMGDEILLENSSETMYNRDRFWARLGHVILTKANQLGPLEGGQFLKNLIEGFDSFEADDGIQADAKILRLHHQDEKEPKAN